VKRILTIQLDDSQSQLKQSFIQAFKSGEYQGEFLNFETPEALFKTLSPKKWTIVSAVQEQSSTGVRELSRLIKRDVRRVHDDLQVLLSEGILEQDEKGKISCPFDVIHFDFELKKRVA
jgi:predicted transcriptional regulator